MNLSHVQAEGQRLRWHRIAYGVQWTLGEMRTGRLTLTPIYTRRKSRLCQRNGHPWQAMVTMSHIERDEDGPWFRVTRRACSRCGWHEEPERVLLNAEPMATNYYVTYSGPLSSEGK